ncbi:hypothetical protein HIJ39_12425 [Sulfobacillus sp. DSM 109850]|uniref:YfiR C-terminal domain-containing protein n=2 Tax=Sulfobacillus harzensis TaxID=2729629 RepID=A0A7Y0Q3M5_9FIRM|nr:hypothetical protein [Sulfobacillus harzensis]
MIVEYNFDHRDDPDRREKILARYDRAVDLLSRMIQAGVDRGEFRPVLSIPALARFFWRRKTVGRSTLLLPAPTDLSRRYMAIRWRLYISNVSG